MEKTIATTPQLLGYWKIGGLLPCRPLQLGHLSNPCTLGENMELWKSESPITYDSPQGSGTPLVLMLGWLMARPRHLTKYTNIYTSKGFDVLQIRIKPSQILWPRKAQEFTEKIFMVLEQEDCRNQPILVHGLSAGAYLYGEMLVKMQTEPEKHAHLCHRIVGQILDSLVDTKRVAYAYSQNLVKHPLLQLLLLRMLKLYLYVFRSSVTDHFTKAQNTCIQNTMSLPSLLFFSHIDPIANPQFTEMIINKWIGQGIRVWHKSWNDTNHVSHFRKYPEEYIEMLLNFLECLPLVPREANESAKDEEIAKPRLQERSSGSLP